MSVNPFFEIEAEQSVFVCAGYNLTPAYLFPVGTLKLSGKFLYPRQMISQPDGVCVFRLHGCIFGKKVLLHVAILISIAYMLLRRNKDLDDVKKLIDEGCDPNVDRDAEGKTPLHLAAE